MKNSQNYFVKAYEFLLAKMQECDKLRNLNIVKKNGRK